MKPKSVSRPGRKTFQVGYADELESGLLAGALKQVSGVECAGHDIKL